MGCGTSKSTSAKERAPQTDTSTSNPSNHDKDSSDTVTSTVDPHPQGANDDGNSKWNLTLDQVTPFSCRHVRAFLKDRTHVEKAFSAPVTGAILFADMSGFTPLTRRLCDKGPAGVEELSLHLNEFFSKMIAITEHHGGDIIKFAGDALLILFVAPEDGGLEQAVTSGARCGLELIDKLNGFSPVPGIILKLHCALTAGQLMDVNVGGFEGQFEHFLSGAPISQQLAPCMDTAGHGQIAASAEACEYLKPFAELQVVKDAPQEGLSLIISLDESKAPPSIEKEDDAGVDVNRVMQFVPSYVLERLEGQTANQLAEMRQVTVLFCKLREHDMSDPEDAQKFMDAVYKIQQIVVRRNGAVRQVITDDKGTVILLMFGLQAGADSPRWAMKSALKIREVVPHPVAIGATTSRKVFCGSVGDVHARCEFAVVGDSVNMAARLMCKVPDFDGVLCDETTMDAVAASRKGDMQFDHFGNIMVKGRDDELAVYRPSAQQQQETEQDEGLIFAGRDKEVEVLTDLYLKQDPKIGRTAPVATIIASAGLGKSAMTRHFATMCEHQGYQVYMGLTDLVERFTPFYCWATLLAELVRFHKKPGQSFHDAVVALVPADDAQLLPMLSGVISGFLLPENSATVAISGGARSFSIQSLVKDILALHFSRHPKTLLVIEDFQWADDNSLKLYRFLRTELPHIPFLLNSRPVESNHPLVSWYGDPPAEDVTQVGHEDMLWMVMKPFDKAGVRQQLANIFNVPCDDTLSDIVAIVHDTTQGVPLFTSEIALALESKGLIVVKNGQFTYKSSLAELKEKAAKFSSVQDVMSERFDTLPMTCQQVLKAASVAGFTFDDNTVMEILQRRAGISSGLTTLVDEGYVFHQGDDSQDKESNYVFTHIIIAEVAYERLVHTHRAQMHRTLALHIEAQYPDMDEAAPRVQNALAQQWAKCANCERQGKAKTEATLNAIHALMRAASTALTKTQATTSAASMYSQAVDLLDTMPDVDERVELQVKLFSKAGPALFMYKGFMGPTALYARAIPLVDNEEKMAQIKSPQTRSELTFNILIGYWLSTLGAAQMDQNVADARRCWDVAVASGRDDFLIEAGHAYWTALICADKYQDSPAILARALPVYSIDPHNHNCFNYMAHDPYVCGTTLGSENFVRGGRPDLIAHAAMYSYDLATATAHPASIVHSAMHGQTLYVLEGLYGDIARQASVGRAQAEKFGIKGHSLVLQTGHKFSHFMENASQLSPEQAKVDLASIVSDAIQAHSMFGLAFIASPLALIAANEVKDYHFIRQILDDWGRDMKRGACGLRDVYEVYSAYADFYESHTLDNEEEKTALCKRAIETLSACIDRYKVIPGAEGAVIRGCTAMIRIIIAEQGSGKNESTERLRAKREETAQLLKTVYDRQVGDFPELATFQLYVNALEQLMATGLVPKAGLPAITRNSWEWKAELATPDWEHQRDFIAQSFADLAAKQNKPVEEE